MPHNDTEGLDIQGIAKELSTKKDINFFRDYLVEHMTGENYYDLVKSLSKSSPKIIKDVVEYTPIKTLSEALKHCLSNGAITEEGQNVANIIVSNCTEKKLAELLTVPLGTAPNGDIQSVNHDLGINVKQKANIIKEKL
jgi:hypothetical protein